MATENKDFRVKNGLIVEGTSATVNGNDVITSASSINELADVDVTNASDTQALVFNAATGKWVPGTATGGGGGGGGSYTISDTVPSAPSAGDVWFDSVDGIAYIYYNDGDTSQWVEIGNQTVGPVGPTGPAGTPGPGLPVGGAVGQIVVKSSTTDYETEWADLSLDKAISELTDVLINSAQNGESLIYDGTDWVNDSAVAYSSSSPTPYTGRLWMDSTIAEAPVLKVYNGTEWVAVSSSGGIVDFFLMGA